MSWTGCAGLLHNTRSGPDSALRRYWAGPHLQPAGDPNSKCFFSLWGLDVYFTMDKYYFGAGVCISQRVNTIFGPRCVFHGRYILLWGLEVYFTMGKYYIGAWMCISQWVNTTVGPGCVFHCGYIVFWLGCSSPLPVPRGPKSRESTFA